MVLSAIQKKMLNEVVKDPYAFPLGEFIEDMAAGECKQYILPKVASAITTQIGTFFVGSSGATVAVDMIQPDAPRKLVLTFVDEDADGDAAGTVLASLSGYDILGEAIAETLNMTVASGAGSMVSAHAYSVITTMMVVSSLVSGTSVASDSVEIGVTDALALPWRIHGAADLKKVIVDGSDSAIATVQASYEEATNTVEIAGGGASVVVHANPSRWEWSAGQ